MDQLYTYVQIHTYIHHRHGASMYWQVSQYIPVNHHPLSAICTIAIISHSFHPLWCETGDPNFGGLMDYACFDLNKYL